MRCSASRMRAARVSARVALEHRHGLLGHDRPVVEALVHEVDRGAAHLDAVLERLALGVAGPGRPAAATGWTFRIRPGKARDEGGRQQAHVAGEADEVDAVCAAGSRRPRRRSPRAGGRGGRGRRRGSRRARARSRPGAVSTFETTTAISPAQLARAAAASMRACRLRAAAADENADLLTALTRRRRPRPAPRSRSRSSSRRAARASARRRGGRRARPRPPCRCPC